MEANVGALEPLAAAKHAADVAAWKALVERYQVPNRWRAIWQLFDTFGAYVGVWVLMYFAVGISWWLAVPLAVLAGGLLVRCFIIFHDCGHGSFFVSRRANDVWGWIAGLLTFTPYYHWRWEHSIHHASAGNLDKRGVGDVWTLTVQEYLEASRWRRFAYRLARNPFVLFVLAPLVLFVVLQRLPSRGASRRERASVWWMNAALLVAIVGMSALFGVVPFLVLQLVALAVAGSAGVWLFYVQHQFEDAYWERGDDWSYTTAALQGSSFYKLPRVLQWFSGNIGFHHIHHLSPRIPNYNLERCHRSDPLFRDVKPVTFWSSFRLGALRLWDESSKKLVGYRHLESLRRRRAKLSKQHDEARESADDTAPPRARS
ncbi:MAG: fatty acid desaturase [Planctomycetes bacterium]|nr:fatty acid desaturase [Planctomycetota bacterium]